MDFNLNRTGSVWDRSQRINTNDNWDKIESIIKDRGVEILSDKAFLDWLDENNFKAKEAVNTFNDLPNNPSKNEIRGVIDSNSIYLFNGLEWVKQSEIDFDGLRDVKNTIEKNRSEVNNNLYVYNKSKKPVVTIIDDDGYSSVWHTLKPMLDSRGLKCDIAMPTGLLDSDTRLTTAQLKKMYDEGYGVLSHSHNNVNLTELNESQLDTELKSASDAMMNLGFDTTGYVYVQNAVTPIEAEYVRRYFKVGIGKDYVDGENLNVPPIRSGQLTRRSIGWGSGYAREGDTSILETSVEHGKWQIDDAIHRGGWLIFVSHIAQANNDQIDRMEQVLDYLVQKVDEGEVDVLTTRAALERFGNKYDSGTHILRPLSERVEGDIKYEAIGSDDIRYNGSEYVIYRSKAGPANNPNSDLPIDSYKDGITFTIYTLSHETGFPDGAGTLETFKSYKDARSNQYWHTINNNIYKRQWLGNSWGEFKKINTDTINIPRTLVDSVFLEPGESHTVKINVDSGDLDPVSIEDTALMHPTNIPINTGIIWNTFIEEAGTVSVTMHNIKTTGTNTGERYWTGKVFK